MAELAAEKPMPTGRYSMPAIIRRLGLSLVALLLSSGLTLAQSKVTLAGG